MQTLSALQTAAPTGLTALEALRLILPGGTQGTTEAAWARLTTGLEGLTVAQVQQRFAAEGIEVAADLVTQIQIDAAKLRPGRELPVIALQHEGALAPVDGNDSPVHHVNPPVKSAIVPDAAPTQAPTTPAPAFRLMDRYQEHIKFNGREPRTLAELAVAKADSEHRRRLAEIKALDKKLTLLDELLPALAAHGVRLNYRHISGQDCCKVLRIESGLFIDDSQFLPGLTAVGFKEIERKPWGSYETVTLKHGRALLVAIDVKKAVSPAKAVVPA